MEQAHGLLAAQKAVVFDIREPHEHARGVAPDMRLLPMSQLKQRMHEIPKDRPVLVICSTQNRSFETQKMLQAAGWNNVRYVEDGMNGWAQHGWPLVGLPAS
ncbi:MAG: rhodanese-like domain-containing protein [Brachymonas sp.]|nr:rhodanese-like domain-containing protein [Brachymonas sp.]